MLFQYASLEKDGQKYMTPTDFIRNFLGWFTEDGYNPESVKLLAGIIDTSKDGSVQHQSSIAPVSAPCHPSVNTVSGPISLISLI